MTRTELIKLHDHLVAHYEAHGAEESAEQISTIEKLLLPYQLRAIRRQPLVPSFRNSHPFSGDRRH